MLRSIELLIAFMGAFVAQLAAQGQEANVAGAWKVTISLPDGQISGVAFLNQDGDKVTGQIGPIETDTMPVDDTLDGNKLTLTTHPRRGRTAAFTKCELIVRAVRMSGTIDTDKGKIEFVKNRPSER